MLQTFNLTSKDQINRMTQHRHIIAWVEAPLNPMPLKINRTQAYDLLRQTKSRQNATMTAQVTDTRIEITISPANPPT